MRYSIIHIILSMIIGVACATSCTSGRDSLYFVTGEELTFEVDAVTRASVTTTSNFTQNPFRIFGDLNTGDKLFDGDKVTYDKKSTKWVYGTPQYWHMGREHSFVAIHPYEIPGMSNLTYSNPTVSFTYTMPEQGEDLRDMVVATHRRKYNFDCNGPIRFEFEHILAKINVAPALKEDLMYDADDESKKDMEFDYDLIKNEFIQIRKVELSGFKTKADISVSPKSLTAPNNQTNDSDIAIEVDDNSADARITIEISGEKSPHILNNGENVSVLGKNVAIVMIPQTFGDNAQIKLEYTVNIDNTDLEELRYVIVPLKSHKLETGKSYTLKFTIEKVYAGQIKDGSIKWELGKDNDDDVNRNWISEDDTIRKDFDL